MMIKYLILLVFMAASAQLADAQPTTPEPAPTTPAPTTPGEPPTEGEPVPPRSDVPVPPASDPSPAEPIEPMTAEPPQPDVPLTEPAADPAQPVNAQTQADSHLSGNSGFTDVRINFTFTNENVFAKPGETIPSVPGWRFGRPNSLGTLFFDNYDTRFSGYETMSHAVLYKKYDFENWVAEGALVLRINDLAENRIDLSDAGSYLRVEHWFDSTRKDSKRISFTAFPTSSDRFRLGYSYRLSWGGSPEYQRTKTAVPGMKVQFDSDTFYAYAGAKSAVVLDRSTAEERSVLAFLGGIGIDVTDMLRLELNGGVFDRGANELQDVIEKEVMLYGASVQATLHKNEPVTSSIDYKLYRNDPSRMQNWFAKEKYPGGLSWLFSAEATVLGQDLKDPEVSGETATQRGLAGDINARVKYEKTRFRMDLQYRDLGFILHSTPSLPTFSDFPKEYDKTGNLFVAVGVDQFLGDVVMENTGLTLGLIVGLDKPATLTTPTGVIPGDTISGSGTSTAVIRNEGDITILPIGEEVAPQVATKFTSRLDFAEAFAALVDIYYVYDPNQTRLRRDDPEELLQREFGEFNQLGFNFTLQTKF